MAGLTKDTSGQWIALSGLTISLSLIAVAVLVNQAAITGYHSSNAALEFPREEIRELVVQTRETMLGAEQLAWGLNNTSNESVLQNFTTLFDDYNAQVSILHAAHGETTNITLSKAVFNSSHHIDSVWLNISYSNGNTIYVSEPEIIGVRK